MRCDMAIDIIAAEMNQVLRSIEIHMASINSNWNKISGGGDIEIPAEVFTSETLAVQSDLGRLLILVGQLSSGVNARGAGA
jgi:hypothetical protein